MTQNLFARQKWLYDLSGDGVEPELKYDLSVILD